MNIKKRMFLTLPTVAPIVGLPLTLIGCSNNSQSPDKPNAQEKPKIFSKLLVMGDDFSDQGAFIGITNDALPQYKKAKFNLSPLGIAERIFAKAIKGSIDIKEPYFQNRSFSNGKVAVEIVAAKMGVPSSPAWSIEDAKTSGGTIMKSSRNGTNFAIGNGVVVPDRLKGLEHFNPIKYVQNKIEKYLNLDYQTQALIKQYRSLNSELIYFNVGHNDLISMAEKYINNSTRITNRIDRMIDTMQKSVNQLISIGANDIIMSNAINISKIPAFLSKSSDVHVKIVEMVNQYNDKLSKLIKKINNSQAAKSKKHEVIKLQDLHEQFDFLETEFTKTAGNHFINATKISSSIYDFILKGNIELEYVNGANKNNLDQFFFLDEVHPTAIIQNKLAEKLYEIVVQKSKEK